jgi:hypothetical protein
MRYMAISETASEEHVGGIVNVQLELDDRIEQNQTCSQHTALPWSCGSHGNAIVTARKGTRARYRVVTASCNLLRGITLWQ